MKPSVLAASAALLAAALAAPSTAATLTWNGGTSGTWDATTANWLDESGAATAWMDGSDAKFNNTAGMTISVTGSPVADNILGSSTANISFKGSGTLAWKGWLASKGHVYFESGLTLKDVNGTGLHFNNGGHVFLRNATNAQTGGTHIKNATTKGVMRAFALQGGDTSLGPVPGEPSDNIFIDGDDAALYCEGTSVTLHRNRKIRIASGATMSVTPKGTIRILGTIAGANNASGYPLLTRLSAAYNSGWLGSTILDPGDGAENYFGRLIVQGNLEIASGQTRLVYNYTRASSAANYAWTEDTPLYVVGGGSAYDNKRGYLLLSGGALVNSQNRRNQVSGYGHVDVAGGTLNFASGELYVGKDTPGKVTVRDGGLVRVDKYHVSQTTAGNGGELFLKEGGTLRAQFISIDTNTTPKGVVHFDGGAIQTTGGNQNISFTQYATSNTWDNVVFQVEAGGAVFDTSNGHHVWFGRPLVSGVAEDETDGGLTCLLGNGKAVVLTDLASGSTYTGPTRVEAIGSDRSGSRRLQCRVANALPATTTLQIGDDCEVGFDIWTGAYTELEQTVARLEGRGGLIYNSLLKVTGAVAPVFDGAYGTLTFQKSMPQAALTCDLEISGDADGCGCVKFESAGQSVSGLTLKVADISKFDAENGNAFYKVVDAPKGYTGPFAATNLPDNWRVRYTDKAIYLAPLNPFVLVVR